MIEIKRTQYNYAEDDLIQTICMLHDFLQTCDPEHRKAIETAMSIVEAVWDVYFGEDEITM